MKRIIILVLIGAIAATALANIPRDNLRAPIAETSTPMPAATEAPIRAPIPTAPTFGANTPTPDGYPAPATLPAYPGPVTVTAPANYVTPTPP
ncbi:MAG: hypothetical protein AMJ53_02880 [Gammaproteobacteria bacterium SG8_11]|nr:MAG: hypothetical protein AMJ53_02880 [Gammaproteobacteria bacterium SG8_11]